MSIETPERKYTYEAAHLRSGTLDAYRRTWYLYLRYTSIFLNVEVKQRITKIDRAKLWAEIH